MTETTRYNKKTKLPFRKSHAFIIGTNDYLDLNKLNTAVNDARKIAEVLEREQRFKVHPPLFNVSYKERFERFAEELAWQLIILRLVLQKFVRPANLL